MNDVLKFRHHRGSLAESLKTTTEYKSITELEQIVNEPYLQYGRKVTIEDFKSIGYDDRCEWNTFYVICRLEGQDFPFVAGMANGIPSDFNA